MTEQYVRSQQVVSVPSVSVVMATFNYGRYLRQSLESIRAQTFTDWEAIVVDDGSTDDTSQVIAPYLADARFRYHRTDHMGVGAAKNTGVRLARGKSVAFLDADDVWLPEKLEKQIALLNASTLIGVVYCRYFTIDPDGRRLEQKPRAVFRGDVLPQMILDNFVVFSSSLVRREVFDAIGLFDEQLPLAVDYDLWLRAARICQFDFVDEFLIEYRTGHANLSRRAEERLNINLRIIQRFLDEHGGRDSLPPYIVRHAFARIYCSLALAHRDRRGDAFASYFRALCYAPLSYAAWRGIVALALPESARRLLRRALGRPVDWRTQPFTI